MVEVMFDGEMQLCAIANALPLMPMPCPIPLFDGEVQLCAIAILREGHRAQDNQFFGGAATSGNSRVKGGRRGAETPD